MVNLVRINPSVANNFEKGIFVVSKSPRPFFLPLALIMLMNKITNVLKAMEVILSFLVSAVSIVHSSVFQ